MNRTLLDPETIDRLASILEARGLTELELQDGEMSLRLSRGGVVAVAAAPTVAAAPVAAAAVPAAPAGEAPPPAGAVPSPMVGIAYLSAEPGAAQFVNVGQPVTAGQTVMLIEAMKTFNQIKAPHAGTVTAILVATGQPVEYGQPLIVIG